MLVVKNALQAACSETNIRTAAEHVGFTYTGGGEVLKFDDKAIEAAMMKHSDKYVISHMAVEPEHTKLRSRAVLEARKKRMEISEFAMGLGFEIPSEINIRQLMLLQEHDSRKTAQEKKSALRIGKVTIRPDRHGAKGLSHTSELAVLKELRQRRATKLDKTQKNKEIKTIRTGQADVLAAAKAIIAEYPKQYTLLKVAELKALLADRGLSDKGKKDDLVSRLVQRDS